MIVFKFGGASVKDANGVRNLLNILKSYKGQVIVVVSALGKTTNALEEILRLSNGQKDSCQAKLKDLKNYHLNIIDDLFGESDQNFIQEINLGFSELETKLLEIPSENCAYKYDQIVSYGELFSTKIVSAYLNYSNLINNWIDIRNVIITDDRFKEARINYELTREKAKCVFNFLANSVFLTQGFIGATEKGETTTLGREGSDFTAAILANVLDAKKVTVWKDVDGILNGDPQYFSETVKLDSLSYQEAVELAYFGAKVIHPKTLKPLHNKNIPLHVRSFINKDKEGTTIHKFDSYDQNLPIYIIKENQVLISLLPKDLSFIIEDEISKIFSYLSQHRIKVNLIQNSAISISFCIDNSNSNLRDLIERLKEDFKVLYNDSLELLTIRHYTQEAIDKVTQGKKIYIEQRSRHTAHFVVK